LIDRASYDGTAQMLEPRCDAVPPAAGDVSTTPRDV
jgi:hypothetical protein